MQILIDTSAIIAVLVNEASKLAIIQATQQTDLLAPPSIHWEIANAFSAMFKRERLSLPEALTAVEIYQQIHYYNHNRIHTALKMSPVQFAERQKLATIFNV